MPILIDNREMQIPEDIPLIRERFGIPKGACLGCWLGDCAPEMHDLAAACEYAGGFVIQLDA